METEKRLPVTQLRSRFEKFKRSSASEKLPGWGLFLLVVTPLLVLIV